MTRTDTAAGWLGNSEALDHETLTIEYTRGTHGEITAAADHFRQSLNP